MQVKVTEESLAVSRKARIVLAALVGLLLIMFLVVLARPEQALYGVARLESAWGGSVYSQNRGVWERWSIALGSFFRGQISSLPEIPELVIDVPFDEISKIYQKREEALAAGHLVQGDDDFVKGEIRLGDATVPVKLRLKGDWNDHLMGRKWSFRIRVRDGEQLLGMRRFSIQSPATRGFHAEKMYFELLNGLGVMTPRYEFVNVILNGDSVGIMALEEFFAKELLEFNRRREGVIVRFDESLVWDARDSLSGERVGFNGAFDDFRNAAVDGIGSSKIAESPFLSEQFAVAAGLLTGFADGRLSASETFDARQLGRFLAASDALGAWHALRWANMRFYLNPVSLKLEPIPFDANLQRAHKDGGSVVGMDPIVLQMLRDPRVWVEYLETLNILLGLATEGSLQRNLEEVEDRWLTLLRTEFRMLSEFDLAYLHPRLASIYAEMSQLSPAESGNLAHFKPYEPSLYPVLAHARLTRLDDGLNLSIGNAVPMDVNIVSVHWINDATGETRPASTETWPVAVPPRGLGSSGLRMRVAVGEPPAAEGWVLEVVSQIAGRGWTVASRPQLMPNYFERAPLPAANVETLLTAHPYLSRDGTDINVQPGSWTVTETLVVPAGYSLRAGPGTMLSFDRDAALVSYSPVILKGSAEAPVRLQASGDSWPGFVVMRAAAESHLDHVVVADTHSVSMPGWRLTGGANFFYSQATIENSRFLRSHGEDALNIVNSQFAIRDSDFSTTVSDAFDSDFSSGSVVGGSFIDIGGAGGGDAIDVSGSEVLVTGVEFLRVTDKALSVGERSNMDASRVSIRDVGTGVASKDASMLKISASEIDSASFAAITAYVKKPEYGSAVVIANDVNIVGDDSGIIAQVGSRVVVDGDDAPTTDIDVDALYETIMKPGLRR